MNKKLLATAIAATVTLSMGTAFAADPVNVSSSFKYEFRNNNDASGKSTANRMQVGINLDGKVDADTTFFGRVAGQIGNFGNAAPSSVNDFKLDQFGVKTNLGGWDLSLGRQGVQLGQGAIFYSGNDIAPLTYFDGITAANKIGVLNFKAVGGKASNGQEWYGADLSGDLSKNANMGLTYANKSNVDATPGAKYWGVYTSVKSNDNLAWTGEYVKSNASTSNRAYDVSGTYSWDKNSFTVAYNNVQANSVDGFNSVIGGTYYPNGDAFTAGYKGFTYAYHHDVSKTLGLNVYLMSLEPMAGGYTNNEAGANLKWKF